LYANKGVIKKVTAIPIDERDDLEDKVENSENKQKSIEELKKIFLIHKKDESFFNKKNPFNDPLYHITEDSFSSELSNKIISTGDNNVVKKVFQKTILNNIVKRFLEKNKLTNFKMKRKNRIKLKKKPIHNNENHINVNNLFNVPIYSGEDENNYVFLNHKRLFKK